MHYTRTFLRRLVPAALVAAPILLMAACASIDCAMTTAVGCRYALRGDTVHDTLTILAVRPGSSDSVLVSGGSKKGRARRRTAHPKPVQPETEKEG